MKRLWFWLTHRHQWTYMKPGWERRCACGRVEHACLVNCGMEKAWFPGEHK